jgi:hypothetical protein
MLAVPLAAVGHRVAVAVNVRPAWPLTATGRYGTGVSPVTERAPETGGAPASAAAAVGTEASIVAASSGAPTAASLPDRPPVMRRPYRKKIPTVGS